MNKANESADMELVEDKASRPQATQNEVCFALVCAFGLTFLFWIKTPLLRAQESEFTDAGRILIVLGISAMCMLFGVTIGYYLGKLVDAVVGSEKNS